jgi:hypothetical protein
MISTLCPKCREELSRIEMLEGRCVNCGNEFPQAASASHGEIEDSPYKPSDSIREPLTRRQRTAILLLGAFLITLLTPAGLLYSCYVAWEKGDSICAAMGCTHDAVNQVEFSGGVKRGYCDEHAKNHAASISSKQLMVPFAMIGLALIFLVHFGVAFHHAYTNKAKLSANGKLRDPFRYFVALALTGILLVNGFYWFMSHYVC